MILDGAALAKKIKQEVKEQVGQLSTEPALAVVLVGDDSASQIYVRNKEKDCAECGIKSEIFRFENTLQEPELLMLIKYLNNRQDISGILVQLPLPPQINTKVILEAIAPEKDVDCFHPENCGRLMVGAPRFLPCTPAGIVELLKAYNIEVASKNCVIINRSNIVGKPLAMLLTQMDGTVTICHSKTCDLEKFTRTADILVSAVGKPIFITPNMIKEGATIIDVGINRGLDGKLCGDAAYDVIRKAGHITPVPGGVGPMTRAMLMKNIVKAVKK